MHKFYCNMFFLEVLTVQNCLEFLPVMFTRRKIFYEPNTNDNVEDCCGGHEQINLWHFAFEHRHSMQKKKSIARWLYIAYLRASLVPLRRCVILASSNINFLLLVLFEKVLFLLFVFCEGARFLF